MPKIEDRLNGIKSEVSWVGCGAMFIAINTCVLNIVLLYGISKLGM